MTTWHIISSKYPPQRGGIGYHSAHIASGLRKKGEDVHIWTSILSEPTSSKSVNSSNSPASHIPSEEFATNYIDDLGVTIHRIAGSWTDDAFEKIENRINVIGGNVLIQYRPESFGGFWSYPLTRFCENIS